MGTFVNALMKGEDAANEHWGPSQQQASIGIGTGTVPKETPLTPRRLQIAPLLRRPLELKTERILKDF